MKTVKEALKNIGITQEVIDTRIAKAIEHRQQKIKHHGWPQDCYCDLCGDTGVDPEKERFCWCHEGVSRRENHERNQSWPSICPARFVGCRIETHPDQDAARMVRKWVGQGFTRRRNLILSGPVGTGKTGLALGAMYELHMQGYTCKFGTFTDILNQLRPQDDFDKAAKRENLDNLTRVGLLVVDDLGAHKESEWTAEQLFSLINGRTSTNRPFIVTTNWTTKEMAAALDERLTSRLAEASDVVPVVGPDLRRTGRAA